MCLPVFLCLLVVTGAGAPVPDVPFVQWKRLPVPQPPCLDVRCVSVSAGGTVWIATQKGVYSLKPGAAAWSVPAGAPGGSCYSVAVDGSGTVWAGAWDGLFCGSDTQMHRVSADRIPISVLAPTRSGVTALGPDCALAASLSRAAPRRLITARSRRCAVVDRKGALWVGTDTGLFRIASAKVTRLGWPRHLVSSAVRGLAVQGDGVLWVGCLGGISVLEDGSLLRRITPREGLPSSQVTCLAVGGSGSVWVGTRIGAALYRNGAFRLYHGLRWLPSDDVRSIACDKRGTAWIGTAAGVAAIQPVPMTLAQKADIYERVTEARHVRPPGLVGKCRLTVAGSVAAVEPADDDNDGQYTSMYLAMEALRYAVTKDPEARRRAERAFHALRFLQRVTGTRSFVARTVVPADWKTMADPNRKMTDAEWADLHVEDARAKRVEEHWILSQDKQWLWKRDTSSDEITGHFFGYGLYYDLAADGQERAQVRDHVRRVMDGILEAGYTLRDVDGKHTHWGVWSPSALTGNPDWVAERGINAVEILSYLLTAYHITGDARYRRAYLSLLKDRGYGDLIRRPKTLDPAWRTHIDDELLALAYVALLRYEDDPHIRRLILEGCGQWHGAVAADHSPLFDFVWAGAGRQSANLDGVVAFLRDAPLDLVRWTMDNTRREDVQMVRKPELDALQTSRMLPPGEICLMRWDGNPWEAVQGDGGQTEADGVFWLLPYWMGRYWKLLGSPEAPAPPAGRRGRDSNPRASSAHPFSRRAP